MVTSIPTFRLKVSEGIIEGDTSADRLFGYCIEANKGPIMEPTFVASNQEAKSKFGVDFAPHFAQNPTGVVICRVGFPNASTAYYEYKMYPEGTTSTTTGEGNDAVTTTEGTGAPDTNAAAADMTTVLQIESVSPGKCNAQVIIKKATSGHGYDLNVIIDESEIVNRIEEEVTQIGSLVCPGGTTEDITTINKKFSNLRSLKHVARKINNVFGDWLVAKMCKNFDDTKGPEWYDVFESDVTVTSETGKLHDGSNGVMRDADGEITTTSVDDATNGIYGTNTTEEAKQKTLGRAYSEAFEKIQETDLIGIAIMSEEPYVHSLLVQHIEHVIDPEIHQLRFGILGYPDYKRKETAEEAITLEDLKIYPQGYDNPWIIYVGQGVIFAENGIKRKVYPHQAVQLYTGIRSSLGYAEAIFGGEEKKVLKNVVDTLPLVTDGTEITRDVREELNETGVCTFKKEYGEVTFLEGVTSVQEDDVLSYENMMSITANVVRRLIKICKPYQGQLLTEDLKSTLQTALSSELQDITNNEGTLMALEDFNIPPYDVQVYSAAKTRYDETHKLIRENKIIVQCRIVPVGALRDIDLGVIVI